MARKRVRQPHPEPAPEPSPALRSILCDLESPDPAVRAGAVRQLCPCRGSKWGVPVFERVLALRNDPSPVVRHAVEHDLSENPDWGERSEARRMAGRRLKQQVEQAREEIRAGAADDDAPAAHSLAWYAPRRPRRRKQHYPAPMRGLRPTAQGKQPKP